MTAEGLRLAHAPIIEAVVDINCDLPPGTQLSELAERAKQALSTPYPKARRQITQRHEFRPVAEEPAAVAVRQLVSGLQFLTDDERQLVQFRPEGYSFNRLAPYSSLDDYLPQIEWSWNTFRELVRPVQIRAIGLRFINRILIPTVEGAVELGDYLEVGPQLPDETLEFSGFLNQYSAIEGATGNQVNITMATQPQEGSRLPIILDIEASDDRPRSPEDWWTVQEVILSLRRLKNRVFERTLTPKCLNLFRQP